MTEPISPNGRVTLDGALTIRTAEATCATLREAFDGASNVSIDCAGASEVDLSFVQMLIAARVSGSRSGKTVGLVTRPDGPLLDTLTRAGFRPVTDGTVAGAEAFWFDGAW